MHIKKMSDYFLDSAPSEWTFSEWVVLDWFETHEEALEEMYGVLKKRKYTILVTETDLTDTLRFMKRTCATWIPSPERLDRYTFHSGQWIAPKASSAPTLFTLADPENTEKPLGTPLPEDTEEFFRTWVLGFPEVYFLLVRKTSGRGNLLPWEQGFFLEIPEIVRCPSTPNEHGEHGWITEKAEKVDWVAGLLLMGQIRFHGVYSYWWTEHGEFLPYLQELGFQILIQDHQVIPLFTQNQKHLIPMGFRYAAPSQIRLPCSIPRLKSPPRHRRNETIPKDTKDKKKKKKKKVPWVRESVPRESSPLQRTPPSSLPISSESTPSAPPDPKPLLSPSLPPSGVPPQEEKLLEISKKEEEWNSIPPLPSPPLPSVSSSSNISTKPSTRRKMVTNPKTGRKVRVGGEKYKQLVREGILKEG